MKNNNDTKAVEREASFHDGWAEEIDINNIDVEAYFLGSTSPENRFLLSKLGNLQDKKVLELGCGAGENSVFFAKRGARCVASDISPGMLKVAQKLAKKNKVKIQTKVIDAMNIDFDDETFDVVYSANTVHHVDADKMIHECWRVLKPGGLLCTWDPLRHNPVINVYRNLAKEVRSADEAPLDISIVNQLKKKFVRVEYETFWLATLWIFIQFYLVERVDPNKERYWKKIILEEERLKPLYLRLEKVDKWIKQFGILNKYCWNIAIAARKEYKLPKATKGNPKKLISLVTPIYNEVDVLDRFYDEVKTLFEKDCAYNFEWIAVDDGSNDGSWQKLSDFSKTDKRVKLVRLANNSGQQKALTAGLDFASGENVVTMDVDGQDPMYVVAEMLTSLDKEAVDIVFAKRTHREGESWFKKISAYWFYKLQKRLSGIDVSVGSGDFRAFNRQILHAVRQYREPHRYLRGIFPKLGFRHKTIEFDRKARVGGQTHYSLTKMVGLSLDGIFSFSSRPIVLILWLSMFSWLVSLFYLGDALYQKYVLETTVPGWTSVVILLTFFTGLNLFSLSTIGVYISKIFEQGQHRPLYVVQEMKNFKKNDKKMWNMVRETDFGSKNHKLSTKIY